MSLTGWLQTTFGQQFYSDTFALHRVDLLQAIVDVLRQPTGKSHWIVAAHFPRAFDELTACLDRHEIRFRIGDRPLDSHTVRDAVQPGEIVVTLAEMLRCGDATRPGESIENPVSVLLVERHPLLRRDDPVAQFVRQIRGQRRLAYYLALDDPLVQQILSPQILEVLRQFGLTERDLVSSHLVSRAIKRWQRKMERQVQQENPADSCAAWLEQNLGRSR